MNRLFVVLFLFSLIGCSAKDDSDPPNGFSNMTPLTDHLTGCQYLRVSGGGVVPRMDGQRQVGCRIGSGNFQSPNSEHFTQGYK